MGGRPWGEGETLLVPAGQGDQKMGLARGDYAVLLSIYHPLAAPRKEGPQVTGRATIMAMVPGAKPLVLETARVDVVETGRRSLRVTPPGAERSPWRPAATSVEAVKQLQGLQGSHHLRIQLTKASATYVKRSEWPGWSLTWRNYVRNIQQAAPCLPVLSFQPADSDLARRSAEVLTTLPEAATTPKPPKPPTKGALNPQ